MDGEKKIGNSVGDQAMQSASAVGANIERKPKMFDLKSVDLFTEIDSGCSTKKLKRTKVRLRDLAAAH
jgi:hypothetical protein